MLTMLDIAPLEAPDAPVVEGAADEDPDPEGAVELAAAVLPEAVEEAPADEALGALDVPAAEEEAGADELAAAEDDVPAAEDEEPDAALLEPEALRQEVVPAFTEKGADCAVAPVESFRVKLIEVPWVMLVGQVKVVPVRGPYCWRGAPVGSLPGSRLR